MTTTPAWCWALVAAAAVLLWPHTAHRWLRRGTDSVQPDTRATPARDARGRFDRLVERLRRRPDAQGHTASERADTLVLLVLALRSGLGLAEALGEVERCTTGPVHDDLAAVVAALRWGRSAGQAWAFAGAAWRPVARAMQVAEVTGAAPADLVADTAARLRELHERELERRAGRAGVLLVLPLGLAFLPAFACTAVVPVVIALARGLLSG